MGRACPREGESPSSLFAPSGDFTDFNGLRKIALRSNEEMPGPETTVASIPATTPSAVKSAELRKLPSVSARSAGPPVGARRSNGAGVCQL